MLQNRKSKGNLAHASAHDLVDVSFHEQQHIMLLACKQTLHTGQALNLRVADSFGQQSLLSVLT